MTEDNGSSKKVMQANQETFVRRWGELITLSGGEKLCKGGAYSYPGALDRYEKALGLKPAESWLIKRMIVQDWDGTKSMWRSFREIANESDVSYNELLEIKKSLELKGYISDKGKKFEGAFNQVHEYSFDGLLRALELAIMCDPESEYGKAFIAKYGRPRTMADTFHYSSGPKKGKPFAPFLDYTTPKQVNEFNRSNGHITPWGSGDTVSAPEPRKRESRQVTCECGEIFGTASRNPKTRCPACRVQAKRQSLRPLIAA